MFMLQDLNDKFRRNTWVNDVIPLTEHSESLLREKIEQPSKHISALSQRRGK